MIESCVPIHKRNFNRKKHFMQSFKKEKIKNLIIDQILSLRAKGKKKEEIFGRLSILFSYSFFLFLPHMSTGHYRNRLLCSNSSSSLFLLGVSHAIVCVSLIDIVYMYSFLDNNNNMFVPQRNLQDSNDCFDFLVKPFFPFFR